jgi:SAM-dependent methyltransferase
MEASTNETTMSTSWHTETGQARLWNGAAGRAWAESQELLDEMFRPFEEMLVRAVRGGRGDRVLDVGCGAGSTTLAAARALGGRARCMGIDISEPLIAAARARAEREGSTSRFVRADAQNFAFERGGFDQIISRFGVMFFDQPTAAFVNLRRAAADGGALKFIAWRSAAENPFMTAAERAAARVLPEFPARSVDGPGQFAFSDPRRVHGLLDESGWGEIAIDPLDVVCTLREKDLMAYATRLGPVGLMLQDADDRTRMKLVEAIRAAFEPFVGGGEVRYFTACWMVSAVAG